VQIIARYITKEIIFSFLSITGILFLIVLCNRMAVYLAKAATGELPIRLVFNIVLLFTPELLSYLIPLSLFIAILFVYGRMYADSEMAVLASCGVGFKYILQLTAMIAFCVMILVGVLTFWVVPKVATVREAAISKGETSLMHALLPGRFQTLGEGKLVFYLEDIAAKRAVGEDNESQPPLKGIFIAERPTDISKVDQGWTLITAEEAHLKADPDTENLYLVLKKGHRYQGLPGSADYTVVSFEEYGRETLHEMAAAPEEAFRQKKSASLFFSKVPADAAEFQWRASLPLSAFILAFIAIPLARVNPRRGRFAKFLPAVVIYIVYYNLFTVMRRWVESGTLPSFLGVWWVHGVFLFVGLGLIAKESGWFKRVWNEGIPLWKF